MKNIHGSKKDESSKQRPPHIDENSLQSMATAKFVDLIGEGEIVGLVHGEQSIFFDNVPIRDLDGNYNFELADVPPEFKAGVGDHNPLKDYPISESEISVDQRLLKGVEIIKAITDPNVDDVRVSFTIPSLFTVDTKSGDVKKTTVEWSIYLRSTSPGAPATWLIQKNVKLYGKCVSNYQIDDYI